MKLFRKREPTEKKNEAESKSVIKMVTTTGEFYYAWNGKLYESDIVRACIGEGKSGWKTCWKAYPR